MFFSLFLGLSQPNLDRNNAGMKFLIFWIFLRFFWEFSCPGRVGTDFGQNFFFLFFLTYLNPGWIEIMPKRSILFFWKFLLFFLEFSCLGRVGTKFGTNFFFFFFFSFSTYLSLVLIEILLEWCFLFFLKLFCYFFLNFLA